MDNERPRKFSSDPRVYTGGYPNWENGIEDEDRATTLYKILQEKFKEAGITIPTDTKILEIGSGNGVFLRYLKKLGLDAVGVDASPRGEQGNNVAQARIEQLPFLDDSFGLIFSNAVFDSALYHQDQLAMVKEIARVLKHGGIYFGNLNDRSAPFEEYFEILEDEASSGVGLYKKK